MTSKWGVSRREADPVPAFELRIIKSPEDLPDCLVSVDARTARGDVVVESGSVVSITNRAPASYRAKLAGDEILSPWWDAVTKTSGPLPTATGGAFGGVGGVTIPAGAYFRLTTQAPFPEKLAGEYTFFALVNYTVAAAQNRLFTDSNEGLGIRINTGAGDLAYEDSSGTNVGDPTTSGTQFHTVLLGAGAGDWRKNGAALFSGGYVATDFGGAGTDTDLFTLGADVAGRLLFFERRLSTTEVEFLEGTVPQLFGFGAGAHTYTVPALVPWTDPAGAGGIDRLNAVSGIPERYYKVTHGAGVPVSFLVAAVLPDGSFDTSADFVGWYVEWPFIGSAIEPPSFPDPDFPGIYRLELVEDGHYLFELWRPGGGAVLLHFDVASA